MSECNCLAKEVWFRVFKLHTKWYHHIFYWCGRIVESNTIIIHAESMTELNMKIKEISTELKTKWGKGYVVYD